MTHSVARARAELASLVAGGLHSRVTPPALASTSEVRKSAVLILFGALDQVAATTPSAEVHHALDVLLTRRAETMRHHPGQISFPGGGVESGDLDAGATALREAEEETGLDPSGVEVLGTLSQVHLPVSNNVVTPVIGWWTRPSEVAAVDRTEAVEVFRAPVAEMLDPANRGTSVLRLPDGRRFRGDAFLVRGHVVWGFTGILLSTIFNDLGWAEPWDRAREFEVTG